MGSETCRSCHPGEYASWHGSFHRTMTRRATPENVRAPFTGELSDRGVVVRLETGADGAFRVHLLDRPGGRVMRSSDVVLTTGSHHLQNYWFTIDGGWYAQLPFTWLVGEGRWVPTQDSFLQPDKREPDPPAVWNQSCVYCHTVGGAGGVSEDGQRAETRVSELGIACEACHGPGQAHVEANRSPWRRYRRYLGADPDPTVAQPARLARERADAVCAQCHGIFQRTDVVALNRQADTFRAGDELTPTRQLLLPRPHPQRPGRLLIPPAPGAAPRATVLPAAGAASTVEVLGYDEAGIHLAAELPAGAALVEVGDLRLRGVIEAYPGGAALTGAAWPADTVERLARALGWRGGAPGTYDLGGFWGDGAVRSAGREANGLARSGCATAGELTCLSCHAMHDYQAPADMLAPAMDTDAACTGCHPGLTGPAHTHHADVTCYDCHMPRTTFGLLGAIRAHRIDSPTAEMSARYGRPNACNLCHVDRPLSWTAEWLAKWYGQPVPALDADDHRLAAAVRWLLEGDGAQRGVAAWAFRAAPARRAAGETWAAPLLAAVLDDDYAAVRAVAGATLKALPGFADWTYDYVAPPAERRAAAAAALARWAGQTPDRTGPAVLIEGPGRPDHPTIEALRHRRDRRPVFVSE